MIPFMVYRVEPIDEDGERMQELGVLFAADEVSALILAKAKFGDVCQHPAVEPV